MRMPSETTTDGEQAMPPRYIGRFVRRQGRYGSIEVLGRVSAGGLETLENAAKLFPKAGCVETSGIHAMQLQPGSLVAFQVGNNPRPGGHRYKADGVESVRRYAELAVASLAEARLLLTGRGWQGGAVGGRWALRLASKQLLLADLAADADGTLRLPPEHRRSVALSRLDERRLLGWPGGGDCAAVYLGGEDAPAETLDWSDDVDHVARAVRSLAGASDPRLGEILSWLERHRDEAGQVSAAHADPALALAALRSGELADRLRRDRDLMAAYLEAAVSDPAVREAVRQAARDGLTQEREALLAELNGRIAAERAKASAELEEELARLRKQGAAEAQAAAEVAAAARAAALEARHGAREAELRSRIEAAEREAEAQVRSLEEGIGAAQRALGAAQERRAAAEREAEAASARLVALRADLEKAASELDRLLEASRALEARREAGAPQPAPRLTFPAGPLAPPRDVAAAIQRCPLLTPPGRELMTRFLALALAGEAPLLEGPEADDFLLLAERLICPGRRVQMEADPALISIEDLWARPGSGAPTALSHAAAEAAEGRGAVLGAIRGVERSAARFWYPALAWCAREGRLPRGLLLCATAIDPQHDELASLPSDVCRLRIEGALNEGGLAGAPLLLGPRADAPVLDALPREAAARPFVEAPEGSVWSISQAMRAAAVHAEALLLTGDEARAEEIARRFAKSIANPMRTAG